MEKGKPTEEEWHLYNLFFVAGVCNTINRVLTVTDTQENKDIQELFVATLKELERLGFSTEELEEKLGDWELP